MLSDRSAVIVRKSHRNVSAWITVCKNDAAPAVKVAVKRTSRSAPVRLGLLYRRTTATPSRRVVQILEPRYVLELEPLIPQVL